MGLESRNGYLCLPDHCLNLLFVFGIYFVAVLGPHQHSCKAESRVLQACPVTLDHSRCQDGHNVCNTNGTAGSTWLLFSVAYSSKLSFFCKDPHIMCFIRKGHHCVVRPTAHQTSFLWFNVLLWDTGTYTPWDDTGVKLLLHLWCFASSRIADKWVWEVNSFMQWSFCRHLILPSGQIIRITDSKNITFLKMTLY